MSIIEKLISDYRRRFGHPPACVARAPGRVNLIGEHTDYNEGFVLPFAIGKSIYVAAGAARSGVARVHSMAQDQTVSFTTDVTLPAGTHTWQNYVRGVVSALRRAGMKLPGVDLCVGGDLPVGGGLSSSAALSVACALALNALAGADLTPHEVVLLARGVEHEFAGTQAGIMDPYASVFGRAGHALLIDCRGNSHEYVAMHLPQARLVMIDSRVKHDLAAGAYLARVLECRRAVAAIAAHDDSVHSLRDVSRELLERHRDRIDEVAYRRARHVITENQRVHETVAALGAGNLDAAGALLKQSHRSLRDDYEVSCPEIEEIVALFDKNADIAGTRMVGGGFGGMVLVLARGAEDDEIQKVLDRTYNRRYPQPARVFKVHPSGGAECVTV